MIVEWSWNDGMVSRSRRPACLVISGSGIVHCFSGVDIPGLAKIIKTQYEKNGKRSNSTYHCVSPQGTKIHFLSQSLEEGLYWPQASWKEVIKSVQYSAPQVDQRSLKAVIREHWGKAAARFDEIDQQVIIDFAQAGPGARARKDLVRVHAGGQHIRWRLHHQPSDRSCGGSQGISRAERRVLSQSQSFRDGQRQRFKNPCLNSRGSTPRSTRL